MTSPASRPTAPRSPRGILALATLAALAAAAPPEALATPALYLPWPCELSYRVTNGHSTSTHTGMDEWAWDFGIPVGAEVASPAAGVVRRVRMDSTRGGCDSAYANDANYVIVDFGDGTEALLMHLQAGSTSLRAGDAVARGDVVGRVGLTGWVCGAHLHFQVQETCGSWWCQSLRAAFVDVGDPAEGTTLAGNNCPVVEPCLASLDGGETIVDELSSCFERETSWWWDEASGYEGHHYYTWANAEASRDTLGRWVFAVTVPGVYRVEAHVPGTASSSRMATYFVDAGSGPEPCLPVDQSAAPGWVELGRFEMTAGDRRSVELPDNTGEDRGLDRRIAYDALRFSHEPASADGDADADGDGGGDGDGDGDADGDEEGDGGSGDSGPGDDADTPPDGASDAEPLAGGCACGAAGAPSRGAAAALAVLAPLLLAHGSRPGTSRRP